MAKKTFTTVSAVIGLLILSGCGEKPRRAAKAEDPAVIGPQYSAKKGLLVPKNTSDSLGVKIVEVSEQKIATTVDLQLRVYERTADGYLASAMISSEKNTLLKQGQPVALSGSGSNALAGHVKAVNTGMQKVTGSSELLVQIPAGQNEFAVGSFLRGRVTLESSNTVATIPRTALLQCSDGHSVYTVSGDHFVRTPIKIGSSTAEFVEVTDGLYAGDKVVLQSVMSLWMTELAAVKGGQACCVEPSKKK